MDDFGEELSKEQKDRLSVDEILAELKLESGAAGGRPGEVMPDFDPEDFDFDLDDGAEPESEPSYLDGELPLLSGDEPYIDIDYNALSADFDEVYSANGGAGGAGFEEDDRLSENFAVVPEEDSELSESFEVAPVDYGRQARSTDLDKILESIDSSPETGAQAPEYTAPDYDSLFLSLYDMRSDNDAGEETVPESAESESQYLGSGEPEEQEAPEEAVSAPTQRQSKLGSMAAEARRHISSIRSSLFSRGGSEYTGAVPEGGVKDAHSDLDNADNIDIDDIASDEADYPAAEPESAEPGAAESETAESEIAEPEVTNDEPEAEEYDFDSIYREYSNMHTDADDTPPDSFEQAVDLPDADEEPNDAEASEPEYAEPESAEAENAEAEPSEPEAAEPAGAESAPEPESYDFESVFREYSAMRAEELSAEQEEPAQAAEPEEAEADGGEAPLINGEEPDVKDDGIEIDSRFNLSGKRAAEGMVFGDKAVDLSADEDYTPAEQHGEAMYHWVAEDENAELEDDGRKRRVSRRKQKAEERERMLTESRAAEEAESAESAESGSSFADTDAGSAEYAADIERKSAESEDGEDYFPPTFRQYLSSLAASVFLRVRGTASGGSVYTMNDSDEELGVELTPLAASRYYGSFIRPQKLRLRIAFVLLLVLCYISIGLPVPGMLKYQPTAAAACCALQFAIMLLSLDVVTNAVLNVFRLKVGADSLSVLACLVTSLDAVIVALSDSATLHMPLCALSSLSLFGAALASSWSTRGMRKAMRVPAIGKRFYSVTGEIKFKDKQLTLLKSLCSAKGFVRRAEEAPPDETAFYKASPFIMLFDFILAVIIAGVHGRFSSFIYIFSAVLTTSVPFMALAGFSLPFFIGSSRIFKSGAAIAGWSGLCDIGLSKNLIVTDRDLFPEGTVTIDCVRIFANESAERIISYAGTLVCASGSCAAASFAKLMENNSCAMQSVENFEYLPGGGMRALINGHSVLCGSTDLMRLMNVRIPYRLTGKTSVLLAIDGTLYGIFTMNYKALPQVRKSLVELVRSSRHPVFAIRDFNVTPEMLHTTFDLATDGYDFPPYVERYGISEPSRTGAGGGKIAAILCNEGLGPLTDVADTGRRIYLVTRLNVILTLLSSVICALIVFIRLLAVGSATPGYLLLLMLAWSLPVFISSLFVLK